MTTPHPDIADILDGDRATASPQPAGAPSGLSPQAVSSEAAHQAQSVPGPYWVRTATNGKHQVCGRHGATIRQYMPDQLALATADARRLQAGYTVGEKALRDAAPDLLEKLEEIVAAEELCGYEWGALLQEAKVLCAKARGEVA